MIRINKEHMPDVLITTKEKKKMRRDFHKFLKKHNEPEVKWGGSI